MALPPALTELADTYPLPSNATFKGGITKFLNYAKGLLGPTGNAAEARLALGIGPVISYRNLLVNSTGAVNQRLYVSGTNTTVANQVTLDRWRVVTSGQNIAFGAAAPDRTITAPAGGVEQIVAAGWIEGGVYSLGWVGTATATVNGVAIANGGQTAALPANTAVTVRFSGGTFTKAQFEVGAVATPFERRPPQVEIALCHRNYAKSYALGTTPQSAVQQGRAWFAGNTAASINGRVDLPVPMDAAPSVTLYDQNGNVNSALGFASAGTATSRAAGAVNITDRSFEVNVSASTDVAVACHWVAATGF